MSNPSTPGASTPTHPKQRFAPSAPQTAEELLSTQTVGLVHLADYRKRRAEAWEQKEKERDQEKLGLGSFGSGLNSRSGSGASTPVPGEEGQAEQQEGGLKKKRKLGEGKKLGGGKSGKKAGGVKLSFGGDDEEEEGGQGQGKEERARKQQIVESQTASEDDISTPASPSSRSRTSSPNPNQKPKSKIAPNALLSSSQLPTPLTKRAQAAESIARETLRKEFLQRQERVKATPIAIPFVFYDGANMPGGVCRVKKGDFVWVFLDGCRKVGAAGGGGGGGKNGNKEAEAEANRARREWARVGVDDLMLVRGEIIIPHHYDFYYFIMNRTVGPNKRLLFDYSAQPPTTSSDPTSTSTSTPGTPNTEAYNPLSKPGSSTNSSTAAAADLSQLEGFTDDPTFTKVVDRRWYERNKHIFPASVWQEFDPEADYEKMVKRDAGGNAFFFS